MTELVTYASRPDLQQSRSPLADLVRRTSSRRIKEREQFHWQQPVPVAEHDDSASPNDVRNQQKKLYLDVKSTLSGSTLSAPHSPLLHTHFARDSTATASSFDDNSFLDTDTSCVRFSSSPDDHSDYDYQYSEDDSGNRNIYLEAGGPSLRDPWRSTDNHGAIFHNYSASDAHSSPPQQEQHPQQVKIAPPPVPPVFVSLHDPPMNNSAETATIRDGPIVKPITNFSRPIRESGQLEHTGAMGERVMPQLPPDMREQKLKVLERNAKRSMAKSSDESMKTRSPLSQSSMYMDALSIRDGSSFGTPSLTPLKLNLTLISILTGWNQSHGQQSLSSPSTKHLRPQPPINSSLHPQLKGSETSIRTVSPISVYSTYSYYEYESAAPSPSASRPPTRTAEIQRLPSSASSNASSPRSPEGLRTPQEYLQLGIQHHEANRLRESARCFERSATEEGGCGVGMLMYGLSLRHGWGCARNEKAGFKWLRKAAEHAVEDLERVRMNGNMDVRVIEASLNDFVYLANRY